MKPGSFYQFSKRASESKKDPSLLKTVGTGVAASTVMSMAQSLSMIPAVISERQHLAKLKERDYAKRVSRDNRLMIRGAKLRTVPKKSEIGFRRERFREGILPTIRMVSRKTMETDPRLRLSMYGGGKARVGGPLSSVKPLIIAPWPISKANPGIVAHEAGHARGKFVNSATGLRFSKNMLGLAAIPFLGNIANPDEKSGRNVALLTSAMTLPLLAAETSASIRGARILSNLGRSPLGAFVGLPSYMAITSLPYAAHRLKKVMGGYKSEKKSKKKG